MQVWGQPALHKQVPGQPGVCIERCSFNNSNNKIRQNKLLSNSGVEQKGSGTLVRPEPRNSKWAEVGKSGIGHCKAGDSPIMEHPQEE